MLILHVKVLLVACGFLKKEDIELPNLQYLHVICQTCVLFSPSLLPSFCTTFVDALEAEKTLNSINASWM